MPNWCSNRLDIAPQPQRGGYAGLKHWIYADGIPAWQTAIAQSLHLLLAGSRGYETGQTMSFPPLPERLHTVTGLFPGNTAFTPLTC